DLQAVASRQLDSLLCVGLRPPVVIAATQVQLPARLFPAVETRVGHELQPFALVHIAELPSHQADLMKRSLAVAVFGGLLEPHVCFLSSERSQGERQFGVRRFSPLWIAFLCSFPQARTEG